MDELVLPGLATEWLGRPTCYVASLSSTNDWLRANADTLPEGCAVIAGSQTKGKGRLGRGWEQRKGAGLALSFLLPPMPPERMTALPLAVGLGVSRALEALCGIPAPIKWSNDVLLGEHKVCGILCESRILDGKALPIAGIGVNLTQTREELHALDLVYATSVFLATKLKIDVFQAACALLNDTEPLIALYFDQGFAALRSDYEQRCVTIGREVRLLSPDGTQRTGRALGVGDDGSLICSIDGRVEAVRAGEVSVRGLYGYT